MRLNAGRVLCGQIAAKLHHVNLVGAIRQANRPCIGVTAGQHEVLTQSRRTVNLHRPVDYVAGHYRCHDLDHRYQILGDLVAAQVHSLCGFERQQPRLLDFAGRLRNILAHRLLFA